VLNVKLTLYELFQAICMLILYSIEHIIIFDFRKSALVNH